MSSFLQQQFVRDCLILNDFVKGPDKFLPALGTEVLSFTVKFVKGIRAEHDAFDIVAVVEAERMGNFVGSFLD